MSVRKRVWITSKGETREAWVVNFTGQRGARHLKTFKWKKDAKAYAMQRIRHKSARPEQILQRAVFQHFAQRAAPGVFAFHVPNGGWRDPTEAAIFQGLGVKAGVPDIIAIKGGKCYALELKTEDGRMTAAQQAAMGRMAQAGAIVDVTYGLDCAIEWLEMHQLLKGRMT